MSMPPGLSVSPHRKPWTRRDVFRGAPLRDRAGDDFWIRVSRMAMACRFEITLASRDAGSVPAARAALDAIDALEERLSLFRANSELADLNRRAATEAVTVDRMLFDLLTLCGNVHRHTNGAFDITTTPLSRCWGFLQRQGQLPSNDAIGDAMSKVGFNRVHLDAETCSIQFERRGVELNLGAVGKGYALDRVGRHMREVGARHALLSAGRSSLLALGGRDGGWVVDIASARTEEPLARVSLRDAAIGTSGSGDQFVVVDDIRYGHVLDPRTGWPASGVLSATVIASSAALADALSTAFLIGGVSLAHDYCRSHPDVMALITPEGARRTILVGQHPGAIVEEA